MSKILITPAAEEDLINLWVYIAHDNSTAADRVYQAAQMTFEARVNMGEYQSASDYLRDLIRHDREATEQLLMAGIESGPSAPLDMQHLKQKALTLLNKKPDQ